MEILIALFSFILFTTFAYRRFLDALTLLFLLLPLYVVRLSIGPLPTTLLEIMILSLSFAWVVRGGVGELSNQWKAVYKERVYRIFQVSAILFLFAAVIGVVISPKPISALGLLRAYWIEPLLVFCMVATSVKDRSGLLRIFGALTLSGCSIASVAIVQKLTGWNIPDPWISERRATSIYPFPNAVGLYLAPIIPLAITFFREKVLERKNIALWRIAGWSSFAILFAGIALAKTEAALVALAVCAVVLGFFAPMRVRIATGVAVALAFLAFAASPPSTQDEVSRKLTLRDWSGKVRKIVWSESAEMLSDRWAFGAGIGGYPLAMVPYHQATHLEIFLYPHNIFLNFWAETGILGVVAFFALVGVFYALLLRSRRDPIAFALGVSMAIILIHGLVDVPYFKNDLSVFFWGMLAFATFCSRHAYPLEEKT